MIENPDQFIPDFVEAGADWISVHQEACRHLNRTLHLIRSHGALAGVVINPGDAGRNPERSARHRRLCAGDVGESRALAGKSSSRRSAQNPPAAWTCGQQRGLNYRIEVDGGIALDTVAEVVRAGAEILVAGNAVFGEGDPTTNARKMLKAATEATLQESSFEVTRN